MRHFQPDSQTKGVAESSTACPVAAGTHSDHPKAKISPSNLHPQPSTQRHIIEYNTPCCGVKSVWDAKELQQSKKRAVILQKVKMSHLSTLLSPKAQREDIQHASQVRKGSNRPRAVIFMVIAPLLDPEDKNSVIQNKPLPSSSFNFFFLPRVSRTIYLLDKTLPHPTP